MSCVWLGGGAEEALWLEYDNRQLTDEIEKYIIESKTRSRVVKGVRKNMLVAASCSKYQHRVYLEGKNIKGNAQYC